MLKSRGGCAVRGRRAIQPSGRCNFILWIFVKKLYRFAGTFGTNAGYDGCAEYHQAAQKDHAYAALTDHGFLMALILIVEDEVFTRQTAEFTIEDLGHGTLLAGDLAGALMHLSASRPIDALFVDIRLDRLALGGYDVANQAIALRPGLRVLYTSGTPLTAGMTDLFVGGGRFLQKPYSPGQLEFSIGELLH
jgi:CheY-like chemotaxis protein